MKHVMVRAFAAIALPFAFAIAFGVAPAAASTGGAAMHAGLVAAEGDPSGILPDGGDTSPDPGVPLDDSVPLPVSSDEVPGNETPGPAVPNPSVPVDSGPTIPGDSSSPSAPGQEVTGAPYLLREAAGTPNAHAVPPAASAPASGAPASVESPGPSPSTAIAAAHHAPSSTASSAPAASAGAGPSESGIAGRASNPASAGPTAGPPVFDEASLTQAVSSDAAPVLGALAIGGAIAIATIRSLGRQLPASSAVPHDGPLEVS